MLTPSMRNWFGRSSQATVSMLMPPDIADPPEPVGEPVPPPEPEIAPLWSPERFAVTDALWGEAYQLPGGEVELLRLAKPLGLSSAASLMLIGPGSGGAIKSLVTRLGVWVNGFEANPELCAACEAYLTKSNLGRRARVDDWDPADPAFAKNYFHHALAIEPLNGHAPEVVLSSFATAIKPGGQLSMIELVAGDPLDPRDPTVAQWSRIEQRDTFSLTSEVAISRVLGRLGYDVRIVEDISPRYSHQAIMGWRRLVRAMEDRKPDRSHARRVVHEAELWLLRLKLIREGHLRVVRWHAINGGGG